MKCAIHGTRAEALRQALEALAGLSFWISWTADPDLAPEPVVSARRMPAAHRVRPERSCAPGRSNSGATATALASSPGARRKRPKSSDASTPSCARPRSAQSRGPAAPAPPLPPRRPSKPCHSALHNVCRQEKQSKGRRIASRAKMRAVADLQVEGVDAMKAIDDHVSCHRYARLRPRRTGGATDPLSSRVSQNLGPLYTGTPNSASQAGATFAAGTRHGEFVDRPHVRTDAR